MKLLILENFDDDEKKMGNGRIFEIVFPPFLFSPSYVLPTKPEDCPGKAEIR
jgi:hypothetical protein